ncbi:TapA domain-containing protein [Bordetella genomosp. 5]|uniref:TapA domain-containing protein n=1 Tax=Bordetella genomosp. 5 TaxID=1395608 RepID=A0A261TBK4_9BORD|nr:TapA domain-containing protein [Bordetella genomosp. 5]
MAQATPVPAGSGAAAAGAATPGAATPGAVTPVPPPPADASAAVRQVPSQPAAAAAASAAAASAAAPAARAGADDLDRPGAVTRALMAAQADGRRAGPGLPLQGPVASAAWQRYIQSFEQPLPQWFGTRIENKSGSGGGG